MYISCSETSPCWTIFFSKLSEITNPIIIYFRPTTGHWRQFSGHARCHQFSLLCSLAKRPAHLPPPPLHATSPTVCLSRPHRFPPPVVVLIGSFTDTTSSTNRPHPCLSNSPPVRPQPNKLAQKLPCPHPKHYDACGWPFHRFRTGTPTGCPTATQKHPCFLCKAWPFPPTTTPPSSLADVSSCAAVSRAYDIADLFFYRNESSGSYRSPPHSVMGHTFTGPQFQPGHHGPHVSRPTISAE
jgi:hypothetical protein